MTGDEAYQQLLRDRIVFLNSEIDSDLTNSIVAQLLFLESEAKDYGLVDTIMDSPGSHQSILDLS